MRLASGNAHPAVTMAAAVVLAIFVDATVYGSLRLNDAYNLLGNMTALLVSFHLGYKSGLRLPGLKAIFASAVLIYLAMVAAVFSGIALFETSVFLGLLLTMPVGAIGYYPSFPDAPAVNAVPAWGLSAMIPMAGYLAGILLRRRNRART